MSLAWLGKSATTAGVCHSRAVARGSWCKAASIHSGHLKWPIDKSRAGYVSYRAAKLFVEGPGLKSRQPDVWEAFRAPRSAVARCRAAAITALLVEGNGGRYQSAAGKDNEESLSFFVAFTDTTSTVELTRLLQDFDARIVDGPKPGGIYQIKLRTSDRSKAAADALQRRLAARRDVVRLVLPAKE